MKFTDQIRSTADLDSRSGEPCGRALRKSADIIDELEAALRDLAYSEWDEMSDDELREEITLGNKMVVEFLRGRVVLAKLEALASE